MVQLGYNIFFGGIGLLAILAVVGLIGWIAVKLFGGMIREAKETGTMKQTFGVISLVFIMPIGLIIALAVIHLTN